MKNDWSTWDNFTINELSWQEQMHIEAGGFWETLGIVCGVLAVAAIIYFVGGLAVLLAL